MIDNNHFSCSLTKDLIGQRKEVDDNKDHQNCQAQARLRHSGTLRLTQAQSGSNSGSVTQAQ